MPKVYAIKTEGPNRHVVVEGGVCIAVTDDLAEAQDIREDYQTADAIRRALVAELGEAGYAGLIGEMDEADAA